MKKKHKNLVILQITTTIAKLQQQSVMYKMKHKNFCTFETKD